jgi:hypothetical protein
MKLDTFWIKAELRDWAHDNYEAFGEEYWSGSAISVRTKAEDSPFKIALAVNGFAVSTPYYNPDPALFNAETLAVFDTEIERTSSLYYRAALRSFAERTCSRQRP